MKSAGPGRHTARAGEGADVLISDANLRQALVATRSLGRAGRRVAVAETPDACDPRLRVPAFHSRWASWSGMLPSIRHDQPGYVDALVQLVAELRPRVLLPCNDGSVAVLKGRRDGFEHLGCGVALASEAALDLANDKLATLKVAADLGIVGPRSVPVLGPGDVKAALAEVGFPSVIKPTQSWVQYGGTAERVTARCVLDEREAAGYVEWLEERGSTAVAQEWVGGRREAVSLLYAGGRVRARFAQVAHRMTPMLGGMSVVRESIPIPEDLGPAALALTEAMGLEGYSEVEFRRDTEGRPYLMEINARLSGSLEVAVRSGVDFPLLVWQWASGEQVTQVDGYRFGVRMRYLTGDVDWLLENITHQDRPDALPRRKALAEFAREFARRSAYDYVDR
ncbi:MAG TPA: ATP-grasp domain-containing protein, partial [Acidimicrobiales bacterium]|nr:ATP-grasp domain-containing protein [Acidimicrobiales bacterium]